MHFSPRTLSVSLALVVRISAGLPAQTSHRLDSLLAPHQAAMKAFANLDGIWRGDGRTFAPSGPQATFVQTIRVGPLGEGSLKMIEGRSYGTDGRADRYNIEVLSYAAGTKTYSLRVYTPGAAADLPITPQNGGFILEYPDGTATVRLTVTVTADTWHEVAERRTPGADPFRLFELTLHRLATTDWPSAGLPRPRH